MMEIRTISVLQHFNTDADNCLKQSGLLGVYCSPLSVQISVSSARMHLRSLNAIPAKTTTASSPRATENCSCVLVLFTSSSEALCVHER